MLSVSALRRVAAPAGRLLAPQVRSMSMLKEVGLDKWQYQLPIGIFLAIPIIQNQVLMLSEEMQLVGCFTMFCGAAYQLGNQAVADALDAKGKAIIAQHNALEDTVRFPAPIVNST